MRFFQRAVKDRPYVLFEGCIICRGDLWSPEFSNIIVLFTVHLQHQVLLLILHLHIFLGSFLMHIG